jgi:hypothetical protein
MRKTSHLITVSVLGLLFLFPSFAQAAILSLTPSSGTYNVGDTFTVAVFVSSVNQSVNAAIRTQFCVSLLSIQ